MLSDCVTCHDVTASCDVTASWRHRVWVILSRAVSSFSTLSSRFSRWSHGWRSADSDVRLWVNWLSHHIHSDVTLSLSLFLSVCPCVCLSVCLSVKDVFKDVWSAEMVDVRPSPELSRPVEYYHNLMTVCNKCLLREKWNCCIRRKVGNYSNELAYSWQILKTKDYQLWE